MKYVFITGMGRSGTKFLGSFFKLILLFIVHTNILADIHLGLYLFLKKPTNTFTRNFTFLLVKKIKEDIV